MLMCGRPLHPLKRNFDSWTGLFKAMVLFNCINRGIITNCYTCIFEWLILRIYCNQDFVSIRLLVSIPNASQMTIILSAWSRDQNPLTIACWVSAFHQPVAYYPTTGTLTPSTYDYRSSHTMFPKMLNQLSRFLKWNKTKHQCQRHSE